MILNTEFKILSRGNSLFGEEDEPVVVSNFTESHEAMKKSIFTFRAEVSVKS